MGIKRNQTQIRTPKKSGAVQSVSDLKKEITPEKRKEIFLKTLQARREAIGALKAQLANYQKAVGSILEIDDALLNMLGDGSPLTK